MDHYLDLQTSPRLSLYVLYSTFCNSNKNYAKLWTVSHKNAVGGGWVAIIQVHYPAGWLSSHQDCWYEGKIPHDIMRAQQQATKVFVTVVTANMVVTEQK